MVVTRRGNKHPLEESQPPPLLSRCGYGRSRGNTTQSPLPSPSVLNSATASPDDVTAPSTPPSLATAAVKELSPSGYSSSDSALEPELPKDDTRVIRQLGTLLWDRIQALQARFTGPFSTVWPSFSSTNPSKQMNSRLCQIPTFVKQRPSNQSNVRFCQTPTLIKQLCSPLDSSCSQGSLKTTFITTTTKCVTSCQA